ncbi:hypothetical protein [Microbacterium xanthum]|uniref:hypothetical protein n=1 Tax=Microbacterium xanthum TaxID=3079794 RepID=UPI002AD4B984|nr:hypothetical protein [Microbacterium sp. KSW-48]MDZ8172890.1 hypothetical protein [Microbacterium sp. KSW-48]
MGRLIAWIAAGTVALAGVAFISVVVFAFLLPSAPPNEDIGNRIAEQLHPYEQANTAPVDLTEVVDADEFTFSVDHSGSGIDYWYISDAERRRHIA